MKKITLPLSLLLGLTASLPISLHAAETDPVGAVSQEIPAHPGTGSTLSLHSLPLREAAIYQGVASEVSGAQISVSATDFTSGDFPDFSVRDANGNPLYYVEFLDGDQEGC